MGGLDLLVALHSEMVRPQRIDGDEKDAVGFVMSVVERFAAAEGCEKR